MTTLNWKFLAIILCFTTFGFYSGYIYKGREIARQNKAPSIEVYLCKDEKTIRAAYYDNFNSVDLLLSDERMINLRHVLAVSGVRYSNTDESVIFWVKGGTARIDEGDEITYEECIVEE